MKKSVSKKDRDSTAYLYLRLSRDDNLEGESYSIGNQKKLLTKAAKDMGYSNLVLFSDAADILGLNQYPTHKGVDLVLFLFLVIEKYRKSARLGFYANSNIHSNNAIILVILALGSLP